MARDQEPEYRRVAAALRAAILSGELADGEQLPSLRELMGSMNASRGAVERALDMLRGEGLILTRHGAGAYVRRFVPIRRSSPGRTARERWGAGLAIQDHDTGQRPRGVVPVVGDVPAPDYVARALGVDPGTPVLSRARRFVVDDRPVQLATSYLPTDLTRGTRIEHSDTGPGGVYARLADQGQAPAHFEEVVRGRAPAPVEAADLELPKRGARVFEITRYAYTEAGRCVEVNRMILDAAAYELAYAFPA